MKKAVYLLFILISTAGFAQQEEFITKTLKLDPNTFKDVTGTFESADFSGLIPQNESAIGFIGDDYERLSMAFLTVTSTADSKVLAVTGKSRVKNNICSFTGTLTVRKLLLGNDNPGEGVATGIYQFTEDSTQSHPGVFTGSFAIRVILDKDARPVYKKPDSNNWGYAFAGDWKLHKGKLQMRANWGDNRIPDSGDLDNGQDNFQVNPKYAKAGWKNYIRAYENKDADALKKEKEPWFKNQKQ